MEILGLLVVCGLLGAALLNRYDKAGTGCVLGLILGPIGVILAWTMRDGGALPGARDEVDCPFCAEPILAKAVVCKHCGNAVEGLVRSTLPAAPPDPVLTPEQTARRRAFDRVVLGVALTSILFAIGMIIYSQR